VQTYIKVKSINISLERWMPVRLHAKNYDEGLGLFVESERNGHQIITDSCFLVSTLTKDEFKTTRYGEFDINHDFSHLSPYEKTVMKKE